MVYIDHLAAFIRGSNPAASAYSSVNKALHYFIEHNTLWMS